jgi:hypothetical protein
MAWQLVAGLPAPLLTGEIRGPFRQRLRRSSNESFTFFLGSVGQPIKVVARPGIRGAGPSHQPEEQAKNAVVEGFGGPSPSYSPKIA